jgi:hypothetical protein
MHRVEIFFLSCIDVVSTVQTDLGELLHVPMRTTEEVAHGSMPNSFSNFRIS